MNAAALAAFNTARLAGAYALHGSNFNIITSTTTLGVTGIVSARDTGREWDDAAGGYLRDHRVRASVRKTSVTSLTREILETCSVAMLDGATTRNYKIHRVTDDATAAEWVMELRANRDGT